MTVAAPEAMGATTDALRALKLPIDCVEFPSGEKWVRGETHAAGRKAIDGVSHDAVWVQPLGKDRPPSRISGGASRRSPTCGRCDSSGGFCISLLAQPDGIDFVIVGENLEDLVSRTRRPARSARAAQADEQDSARLARLPSERGI